MKINDARFKKEELLWDDLETGTVYEREDHLGDRFTLVDAVLEIR